MKDNVITIHFDEKSLEIEYPTKEEALEAARYIAHETGNRTILVQKKYHVRTNKIVYVEVNGEMEEKFSQFSDDDVFGSLVMD